MKEQQEKNKAPIVPKDHFKETHGRKIKSMSISSPLPASQKPDLSASSRNKNSYFEILSRSVITSWVITVILYPIDNYASLKELKPHKINIKDTFTHLPHFKFGMIGKNYVLQNLPRNVVASHEKNKVETEVISNQNDGNSAINKAQASVWSSMIIALADTTFSQFPYAERTLKAMYPDTTFEFSKMDKLRLAKIGMPARLTRNFFGTLACISGTQALSPLLSKENDPCLNQIITALISGISIIPIITPLENIHKNALSMTDLSTLKAPSIVDVIKKTFDEGKLFEGAGRNAIRVPSLFFLAGFINEALSQGVYNHSLQANHPEDTPNKLNPGKSIKPILSKNPSTLFNKQINAKNCNPHSNKQLILEKTEPSSLSNRP